MMRDHTKLQAFELADEVAVWVYRVTVFPREELGIYSKYRYEYRIWIISMGFLFASSTMAEAYLTRLPAYLGKHL